MEAVSSLSKMARSGKGIALTDKLNIFALFAMVLALVDVQYGFEWASNVSPFEACEFLRSPRDAALLIEYYGQQPSFLDWRTRNSKFKIDLDF